MLYLFRLSGLRMWLTGCKRTLFPAVPAARAVQGSPIVNRLSDSLPRLGVPRFLAATWGAEDARGGCHCLPDLKHYTAWPQDAGRFAARAHPPPPQCMPPPKLTPDTSCRCVASHPLPRLPQHAPHHGTMSRSTAGWPVVAGMSPEVNTSRQSRAAARLRPTGPARHPSCVCFSGACCPHQWLPPCCSAVVPRLDASTVYVQARQSSISSRSCSMAAVRTLDRRSQSAPVTWFTPLNSAAGVSCTRQGRRASPHTAHPAP